MLWLCKGFGFAGHWTVNEQNRLLGFCFGILSKCVPFIVKIDIEGFETSLLMTNNGWVDTIPLVVSRCTTG